MLTFLSSKRVNDILIFGNALEHSLDALDGLLDIIIFKGNTYYSLRIEA